MVVPKIIETTAIPISGENAWLGAAAYIAVLGYPRREDWPKRSEFIEAIRAAAAKRFLSTLRPGPNPERSNVPPQYRVAKNQQIDNAINRAVFIIMRRRMPAARMAKEMIFGGLGGYNALSFLMKSAFRRRAPSAKIDLSAISRRRFGTMQLARLEAVRIKRGGHELNAANGVVRDVWMDSLPVIFLAVAFHDECMRRFGLERDFDLLDLIRRPSWVAAAVRNAERLRLRFHRHAGSYKTLNQKEVVVLVGKECC